MIIGNLFKNNKFFLSLAVLLLLIFFHYTKISQSSENFIYHLVLPVQNWLYAKGSDLEEFITGFNTDKKDLLAANKSLQEQEQNLIIEKSHLLDLVTENKLLREQLNFLEDKELEYLLARVVGSNFEQNIYSYILNKGEQDGVIVGQPVFAGPGIVVGKIYKVFAKKSELLLLTDNKSALAAVVQNEDNSQGLIEGHYGLTMKMNLIPQNEEIKSGDIIITSGIEPSVPRGLVVGQVDKVESKVNELFQTAIVSPVVDYRKLNLVTIITGFKEKK